jgi:hypothetical protein
MVLSSISVMPDGGAVTNVAAAHKLSAADSAAMSSAVAAGALSIGACKGLMP